MLPTRYATETMNYINDAATTLKRINAPPRCSVRTPSHVLRYRSTCSYAIQILSFHSTLVFRAQSTQVFRSHDAHDSYSSEENSIFTPFRSFILRS